MDNEEKFPPFVQDYLNKMDYEGYSDFVKQTRDYHKAKEEYPGKFATQKAHLEDFNRRTGQNRQLNYEDGLNRIEADFKKDIYQTAKKHGYTGPDPNTPADKEFTKQGEKFNNMIDDARQRQEQQKQQETKQSSDPEQIKALKDQQQHYQQNPPKVEFKGAEQSASEQPTREQQRAAFLEQINQVRQQQQQRTQGGIL